MAGRCRTVFDEQPSAMSTVMALATASGVTMSRGRILFSSKFITCIPAFLARRTRADETAGIVPFPGRATPIVSARQFMEFAVNIPAHAPQPGQARSLILSSSASVILPAPTFPTASKTVIRSPFLPFPRSPGSMGPPETRMEGMFRRIMAINMPGTVLSQLGIKTRASKAWARVMISMESAINSREGREKRMPS